MPDPEDDARAPVIRHWLVSVARAARLEGAAELDVDSDADAAAAWDLVAMAAGFEPSELATIVAAHYRLPVADLDAVDPQAHRLLPGRLARKHGVLALRFTDRFLWAATADPVSLEAEKEVAHVAGRNVYFEVAPPGPLAEAIEATYPLEDPPHQVPPLDTEGRGGRRILVVDDDADTRLVLRAALEKAGFRVTEAADGAQALELLAERGDPFALVTLDLDMPEMNGLDVLRTLRGRVATASLPVVVATGLADPEVEMELFEAGADDFIVKPVDPPRVLLRVQAVLRRHSGDFLAGL